MVTALVRAGPPSLAGRRKAPAPLPAGVAGLVWFPPAARRRAPLRITVQPTKRMRLCTDHPRVAAAGRAAPRSVPWQRHSASVRCGGGRLPEPEAAHPSHVAVVVPSAVPGTRARRHRYGERWQVRVDMVRVDMVRVDMVRVGVVNVGRRAMETAAMGTVTAGGMHGSGGETAGGSPMNSPMDKCPMTTTPSRAGVAGTRGPVSNRSRHAGVGAP